MARGPEGMPQLPELAKVFAAEGGEGKAKIVFDNLSLCELKYFSASESQSWCSKAEHDQSFL